jgi:hypothetical protein
MERSLGRLVETEAVYIVTLPNGKKTRPYPLAKIRSALEAGRISADAVVESQDGVTTVKDLCGANLIERTQDAGSGYGAFCKRRAIRKGVLGVSLSVFALLFLSAAGSPTGFIVPLLFFGFLAALVTAGYVLWAKNDPDPNPAETERRRDVAKVEVAALAEERAIKNAELKRIRDEEKARLAAEREVQRQEEERKRAELMQLFCILHAGETHPQYAATRREYVTYLLTVQKTDPKNAAILAKQFSIDLEAERQGRALAEIAVLGGAAAIGLLGAALAAGAAAMNEAIESRRRTEN